MSENQFYLVGDFHGDLEWASQVMRSAWKDGVKTIFQLGDFGVWPGEFGKNYLDKLSKLAVVRDIVWKVTLGNHEDYGQIDHLFMWGAVTEPQDIRENITILGNKAQVFSEFGLKFASLGGAVSIDRFDRVPGKSWWPQEKTTDQDVRNLAAMFGQTGWSQVDVLLTHDAPPEIPTWYGFVKDDIDSTINRQKMGQAHTIVNPRVWFHGHYHRPLHYSAADGHTDVIGLGANPPAMYNDKVWLHGSVMKVTVGENAKMTIEEVKWWKP
jgi:hypothetical protein